MRYRERSPSVPEVTLQLEKRNYLLLGTYVMVCKDMDY